MKAENKYPVIILILAGAAVVLRIAAIFILDSLNNPELWEFGQIAGNLLNGEGFTYLAITKNVPSAYMPPGLPYLYYFIFSITSVNYSGYLIILILNAVLGGVTVLLMYSYSSSIFDHRVSIYSSIYAALSPVFIYSSVSFTPIIIYHVLLLLLLIFINRLTGINAKTEFNNRKSGYLNAIYLAVVLGAFLYLRAESLIFIGLCGLYFLIKKKPLTAVLIIFISLLIISPWSYRNYKVFGIFVPVATSFGYNFYTGHGDEHSTIEYNKRVSQIPEDSLFEIKKSELSVETAIQYISSHPGAEIKESFKKIFSLWVFDLYRYSAKHPLYLLIWMPTLIFFGAGLYFIIKSSKKFPGLYPAYLYFLFSTILVVVFFNIPRYQIQMSIAVIPISMYGLQSILEKVFKKKNISE